MKKKFIKFTNSYYERNKEMILEKKQLAKPIRPYIPQQKRRRINLQVDPEMSKLRCYICGEQAKQIFHLKMYCSDFHVALYYKRNSSFTWFLPERIKAFFINSERKLNYFIKLEGGKKYNGSI